MQALKFKGLLIASAILSLCCCMCGKKSNPSPTPNPTPTPTGQAIDYWFTKSDQSELLNKQTTVLRFGAASTGTNIISIDSASQFQTVDGFGYTLTGASAKLINALPSADKSALLQDLFGSGGIAVSYLRISIGASDLSTEVFSYDDLPVGQTDPSLANFSLSKDTVDLIPVLQQILSINPNIKILGSPWSPPVWMKSNGSSIGGSLLPQYYGAYANYFVKYIQAMKAKGITIDAVTIQNEPEHGGNNPSMLMTSAEQANFIKNNLGSAFQAAGIATKIIVWDHNCDHSNYPIEVMNDAAAKAFINGAAFHLYAGSIDALSTVHFAHPDKQIYFTEQWTGSTGSFSGDFLWHIKNVMIGSMRNWSRNALEWNLANDPMFSMHTPGGCTQCKGALTINGSSITKNVSYYIVAQMSKFVSAGSVRVSSSGPLSNVAFVRPDGKKVLVVLNDGSSAANFDINFKGQTATATIPAGTAGTYVW